MSCVSRQVGIKVIYGIQLKCREQRMASVEGSEGSYNIRRGVLKRCALSEGECPEWETVARPSVVEVVVPNAFPGFIIVIAGGIVVLIESDHRADTLDVLKTGFYIKVSTMARRR